MMLKRRSTAAAAILLGLLASVGQASAQKPAAPRGELRIVDPSPFNWVSVTLNVFEHLWELDPNGKLVPRLATGWRWLDDRTLEVKLRRGDKFHNGEAFDAQIVKLNWDANTRAKQPHMIGVFMNFKPGSRIEIVDPLTVRFVFSEPDGGALYKLQDLHIGNRQFYREMGWGEKHW
jgi:ABC-type transport system substrate-binding protein